jgi:hypothetical protein
MKIYLDIRRGLTLWPFMFLPLGARPWIEAHEEAHYEQQRWTTPVWVIKYLFSKSFRWEVESAAFRREINVRVLNNSHFLCADYAFMMAYQYRDMVRYADALTFCEKVRHGHG